MFDIQQQKLLKLNYNPLLYQIHKERKKKKNKIKNVPVHSSMKLIKIMKRYQLYGTNCLICCPIFDRLFC